jgi:threonylcarbamoyladenosine tRNA methylthiotransferase CDKAL1
MEYVYLETYGCSANRNNSEILKGLLKQAGYEITNNENIAEIIIINSCVVKSKTINKINRKIQDLGNKKLVVVTGCMPDVNAKHVKQLNPNTILLGTNHFKDIIKLLRDFKENRLDWKKQDSYLSDKKEEKINLPKIPDNNLISIIQISEGCNGSCAYCLTRIAKGRLFSYAKEKIIKSIELDLQNGAKEIWITSQDCANYGLDKGKQELPELLASILNLKHNFKLRLGMMDPNNVLPILEDLIELYKNKKIYKFLHIPIQSASNKVLKDMNRLYTIEQAEKIIQEFRKNIPDITISTDIIIGYPTETDKDFRESLNFVKEFKPEVFNLSKMSIHKQTPAENLKPLDIEIINKRTSEIMEVHRKTALESKKKFLNKTINVFVNKKLHGFYESRDINYNIVLIKENKQKNLLGKNIDVKITSLGVHHMIGEEIKKL